MPPRTTARPLPSAGAAGDGHAPRVLHALPGRVRVHLPEWDGTDAARLERELGARPGIRGVRAGALTRNLLVLFDPERIEPGSLLRQVDEVHASGGATAPPPSSSSPSSPAPAAGATEEAEGTRPAAEASVPSENAAVVGHLARLVASLAGLAWVGLRRLAGSRAGPAPAVWIAAGISILEGTPAVRSRVHRGLGTAAGEAVLSLPKVAILALANSPLGLTVLAVEALVLVHAARSEEAAPDGPWPRLAPAADEGQDEHPSLVERYSRMLTPWGVTAAVLTGVLTRSPTRAAVALILVSPRGAVSGERCAEALARARLSRRGVRLIRSPGSAELRLPESVVMADGNEPGDRKAVEGSAHRHDARLVRVPAPPGDGASKVEEDPSLAGAVSREARGGCRVGLVVTGDRIQELDEHVAADWIVWVRPMEAGSPPPEGVQVDVLAPDLSAAAEVLDVIGSLEASRNEAVGVSVAANLAGLAWLARGAPTLGNAAAPGHGAALVAMADAWIRMRGEGEDSGAAELRDPRPERWGDLPAEEVLQRLGASPQGLSTAEALARRRPTSSTGDRNGFGRAVLGQIRTPLTGLVVVAGGVALLARARTDALLMGATLVANVLLGAWQDHRVATAAEGLRSRSAATGRVLRDGAETVVPASEVVPGDVLLLAPGERVPGDARVLSADTLEVDEAALTGESVPVGKRAEGGAPEERTVLHGSDVVVGHGRAVVVAVGPETRMGATMASLEGGEQVDGELSGRLSRMFQQLFPVSVAGGALVAAAGLLRGGSATKEILAGASIALAVIPEALPAMAALGQSSAARRLARHGALVRRPAAVEALGRVDVACVDKTGTLTRGKLTVHRIATSDEEAEVREGLPAELRRVLEVGALASPHPDAGDAHAHSTDVAVREAARRVGLDEDIRAVRGEQARFNHDRSFHAARVDARVVVKGAPEVVVDRCATVRRKGDAVPLDEGVRDALGEQAHRLASEGLRVLAVAEGDPETDPADPDALTFLGYLGITDPLRATVPASLERCAQAGIRVVMLTGDHPETAVAIAREAGLDVHAGILTGREVGTLDDAALDARLERVCVIARATPLDKLRIIESLRRKGHTIAMTGDGVNDAPALRLADVGVAMGSTGTDVARETSDLVLAGDDFSSLVDALIEGRSFWRNLRRALGLLLGGNMGELSFMVTTGLLGLAGTLTVRQILATNLITDALPAVAVAVQEPEDRRLEGLEREGRASLGRPLRDEILRRTFSTSGPALASYLVALRAVGPGAARTVGFGTIVSTQLALTVDASRRQGTLTASVATAVGISGGALLALLTVPGARGLFQLSPLSPLGWSLIGVSTAAAPLIGRVLESLGEEVGAGAPTVRRAPKPRGSLPPVGVRPALPS